MKVKLIKDVVICENGKTIVGKSGMVLNITESTYKDVKKYVSIVKTSSKMIPEKTMQANYDYSTGDKKKNKSKDKGDL